MHSLIIHDISRDILTSKVYEGDPQTEVNRIKSIENGDDYNLSAISMSTHTGTHIDAPLHFSSDGSSISKMRLNTFTGKCTVVTVNGILTGEDMDKILVHSRKKLLLHGNCKAFVSAFAARVLADSDVDVFTAKNAGVSMLGVEWGFRGRKELTEAGAPQVAATADELLNMILAQK